MHAAKLKSHLDAVVETEQSQPEDSTISQFRFALLQAMLERLSAKPIEVYDAEELSASIEKIEAQSQPRSLWPKPAGGVTAGHARKGLIYRQNDQDVELDNIEVSVQARVICADEQELEIDAELKIDRGLLDPDEVTVRGGYAHLDGQLLLEYEGPAARLGQRDFIFEIELDGHGLPVHGDGYRNSGDDWFESETAYAQDEPDYDDGENLYGDAEVEGHLKVWIKDEIGGDYLLALGEAGVDAILLGHVDANLQLVAEKEVVVGHLSGSSFYIDDNGEAGLIQEAALRP